MEFEPVRETFSPWGKIDPTGHETNISMSRAKSFCHEVKKDLVFTISATPVFTGELFLEQVFNFSNIPYWPESRKLRTLQNLKNYCLYSAWY